MVSPSFNPDLFEPILDEFMPNILQADPLDFSFYVSNYVLVLLVHNPSSGINLKFESMLYK